MAADERPHSGQAGRRGSTIGPAANDELSVHHTPTGDQAGGLRVAAPGRSADAHRGVARDAARAAIDLKAFEMATVGTPLGDPRSALVPVAGTPAWQQTFDRCWVIWHPNRGAFALRRGSAIARRYAAMDGPAGYLGCPVTDEHDVAEGTMCRFELPGGALVWSPEFGVHETRGAIGEHYLEALGGPRGGWGFPRSDEYDAGKGVRAQDFLAGTLAWRDGIVEQPVTNQPDAAGWLSVLDEPRRGATGGPFVRPHSPAAVAICRRIDRVRSLIQEVDNTAIPRRQMVTAVEAEELVGINGTILPPGVTPEQLLDAHTNLWHDLWGAGPAPTMLRPFDVNQLTWSGFAADGELQSLVCTLFARCPEARMLFLSLGISVEELGRRHVFVVADTEHGRRLYAEDAERAIIGDPRLLSLFTHMARGSIPRRLLAAADLDTASGPALRQAMLDAQFLTATSRDGGLPGWSLLRPWTRKLRAAVAHNIRAGCLSGWDALRATEGEPVEVVRALVWDFFCGPAALLAQSRVRFEGALSHDALGRAARSFPVVTDHDDGHARYILAGSRRRRVEAPT